MVQISYVVMYNYDKNNGSKTYRMTITKRTEITNLRVEQCCYLANTADNTAAISIKSSWTRTHIEI